MFLIEYSFCYMLQLFTHILTQQINQTYSNCEKKLLRRRAWKKQGQIAKNIGAVLNVTAQKIFPIHQI